MNIITKLNIRQKIMLALTLLAAIFLVWQIYTFVHNDAAPGRESSSSSKSTAAGKPLPGPDANATPSKVIHELPSAESTNPALVVQQRQYLELVRQYQITKMKRQILEEQAAVANAQKRISDAGKGHDYGNLDSLVSAGGLIAGYQLSYVDRQAGQWSATVSENGQYREVHVGSRLADGSRIVSIHSDKVVLRHRQGQKWELTFPGSPNVDENAAIPSTKKSINNGIKTNIPAQQIKPDQSNAKIAKILGITSTPGQSAPAQTAPTLAVTPPASSVSDQPVAPTLPPPRSTVPPQLKSNKPAITDVPAAPLTITPPVTTPPIVNVNPEAVTESNSSVQAPTPVTTEPPVVNDPPVVNTAPSANVEDVTLLPDNEMTAEATLPAPSTAGRPVSVKELREHNATQNASAVPAPVALDTSYEEFNKQAAELNQISSQQAADLQAAVLNDQ